MRFALPLILSIVATLQLHGQVYSPRVLTKDQPDTTELHRLAQGIYRQANAHTPRERAEAVWRFFLTDGRFVKPGFWYHIAGWAYEEPAGEVLDPLKLLNSYGFGLCYHIAPLLESVWKAGGFEDARVWFLSGHTVAEVFYDGSYHHFDSDMMGYNTTGRGPARSSAVASVHDLETDPVIMTGKLLTPTKADITRTSDPWYPADVQAAAIPDLASAFTTTGDNHLFPYERSPGGHTMDFVLRPGERLIRYFKPETEGAYYLPYKWQGKEWAEFPQEIRTYAIRTEDGPKSQKDARRWATGALEYRPLVSSEAEAVYEVHSPYVVIDAEFQLNLTMESAAQSIQLSTSTDNGRTWATAATLRGPHAGPWRTEPAVLTRSAHGRRTNVSGAYGYLLKVTRAPQVRAEDLLLRTRIQVNPRSLPELKAGRNELVYAAGASKLRRELSIDPSLLRQVAYRADNANFVTDGAQGFWLPAGPGAAEFVFRLTGTGGGAVVGIDAGGRFLDLTRGIAPDKFTAETRPVAPVAAKQPAASIAWSKSPDGPFETIWAYDPNLKWLDGRKEERLLRWPEADRHVAVPASREIYVRYRVQDLALDQVRLALETQAPGGASPLHISHLWKEQGAAKSFTQVVSAGATAGTYTIDVPDGAQVLNEAIILECKRPRQ
ncbi:MAG: hypothetical protein IPP47_07070 [Bryobacterales bacterium]|nr:hypothetical protein [Bryobacterales bacterium]